MTFIEDSHIYIQHLSELATFQTHLFQPASNKKTVGKPLTAPKGLGDAQETGLQWNGPVTAVEVEEIPGRFLRRRSQVSICVGQRGPLAAVFVH